MRLKGFCIPPELSEEMNGEGESQPSGGMGLGDGEGEKDVSDRIESEDQLEDAQPADKEKEKDDDKECKEEDKGIEMSEDFDGKLQVLNKKLHRFAVFTAFFNHSRMSKKKKKVKMKATIQTLIMRNKWAKREKTIINWTNKFGMLTTTKMKRKAVGFSSCKNKQSAKFRSFSVLDEKQKEERGDKGEPEGEAELAANEEKSEADKNQDENKSKENKNKEINEMLEPEFDDEQTDPYHGNQPELPEPEPMDLPDDLQCDDQEEQNEQQEENPFDIDKQKGK